MLFSRPVKKKNNRPSKSVVFAIDPTNKKESTDIITKLSGYTWDIASTKDNIHIQAFKDVMTYYEKFYY